MKKLFGVAVVIMLGLNMVGCEETIESTNEEPKVKQEETIKVEEKKEEVKEEVVEEPEVKVEVFDEEKFNYYTTTSLSYDEYKTYFDEIKHDETGYSRDLEFDGYIVEIYSSEKYNTRSELALAAGDYDGINVNNYQGVTIMTRDIANYEIAGLTPGTNVKVKMTIERFDDGGYLKIYVKEIEAR